MTRILEQAPQIDIHDVLVANKLVRFAPRDLFTGDWNISVENPDGSRVFSYQDAEGNASQITISPMNRTIERIDQQGVYPESMRAVLDDLQVYSDATSIFMKQTTSIHVGHNMEPNLYEWSRQLHVQLADRYGSDAIVAISSYVQSEPAGCLYGTSHRVLLSVPAKIYGDPQSYTIRVTPEGTWLNEVFVETLGSYSEWARLKHIGKQVGHAFDLVGLGDLRVDVNDLGKNLAMRTKATLAEPLIPIPSVETTT